jgi:hypothetical protein
MLGKWAGGGLNGLFLLSMIFSMEIYEKRRISIWPFINMFSAW